MDRFLGTAGQIPAGLFLCAGAVLESNRLAMVVPADTFFPMRARIVPRHPQSSFKTLPERPNAAPGGPKCTPRLPKVPQRVAKGSPKRNKRSAMQSPKHAWALQSECKGGLYTLKLPINRSSGHYVNTCAQDCACRGSALQNPKEKSRKIEVRDIWFLCATVQGSC